LLLSGVAELLVQASAAQDLFRCAAEEHRTQFPSDNNVSGIEQTAWIPSCKVVQAMSIYDYEDEGPLPTEADRQKGTFR
jgi:hypothetical protein